MQKRIIYILGFLVLTVNGIAQDKLSLTDAIQIGLKTNYQIQISGKDIQIAKRNNNWLGKSVV